MRAMGRRRRKKGGVVGGRDWRRQEGEKDRERQRQMLPEKDHSETVPSMLFQAHYVSYQLGSLEWLRGRGGVGPLH